MSEHKLAFYEFFAGGGMARIGLGPRWHCTFANDCCEKKARSYRSNFGDAPELVVRDIRKLKASDLPGMPSLVWASFPCQDLSLAGNGEGLSGDRSGTFWSFWALMQDFARVRTSVPIIVLENVVGAISSNKGGDLRAIITALSGSGYHVGGLVVNAVHFLPHSRPRLFIVAVDRDTDIPDAIRSEVPNSFWHPTALRDAYADFPSLLRAPWVWWHLPAPPIRTGTLADLVEEDPTGVEWHTASETSRLLAMMSPSNIQKVQQAKRLGKRIIGTVYRRTRADEAGKRVQRAEVRFDQVSGCLRTPAGGSSRQTILVVRGNSIRSRLLSPREAARLMGVPDTYNLPENYNEAYHLMGDGVVVPVVSWLETHLLRRLVEPKKIVSGASWREWTADNHSLRAASAD